MKILKVIHGYPMRYNAGSEVYSQTLCQGLANRHCVHVFTREENPFIPDHHLRVEQDTEEPRITLHTVNNPHNKDRYRVEGIDQRFAEVLSRVEPDVVHVGHLNHLSTSLLQEAARKGIPIVYTLHDYWLMCPRGQFVQMYPENHNDLWATCDGQDDRKCAQRCYARYMSGATNEYEMDVTYWTDWVSRRMSHIRNMSALVDLFIAPARYLMERYQQDFRIPANKIVYLDYGFDLQRLSGRQRVFGEPFTFGYIGTHIPTKGIHDLIRAFGMLQGKSTLRIWGRPRGQETEALKTIVNLLPPDKATQVEWRPEYRNRQIIQDVFNQVDAIVVPSIWVENSPLVIHEAQQARVPVVTANAGGMAEYVHHEVNGLLFQHRSHLSLATQMQRFVDDPNLAQSLGQRGYLFTENHNIPSLTQHIGEIERLYEQVLNSKNTIQFSTQHLQTTGPWRITFDTNPDTCNLHCIMCEEHSLHSSLQKKRKTEGNARRIMPIDLIKRVVTDAVPHGLKEIIPSTMGEPLLYEHFEDILALCEKYNIKLNLTTNGTFPRRGVQDWAERIVPFASDVKISWNGSTKATQETIMLGSVWEKVLANVTEFIAVRDRHAGEGGNRCRVTFQLTFLETNVHELADIVALAIELGVDRVKGHHLWAHFKEIKNLSMRKDLQAIQLWNKAVAEAQTIANQRTLTNGEKILLENIFPLDEKATEDLAPGGDCPFLGQEAWVSALGRFDPCCAPDEQRRTLGEFGNLHEYGIMEIWNSTEYRDLMATYRSRKLCLGCNMRKPVEAKPQ